MKHVWKILLLIPIIALFQVTYSGELRVDTIEVLDKNTVKVTLSENPNMKQGENEGEITILNDMKIESAVAKLGVDNQVEVFLSSEILPETSYSLLTVAGSQGSIDFTTPLGVEGFTQVNVANLEEQTIESIEVIDKKTLLVQYKQAVTASSYDFKLLAESKVVKIEKLSYELPELLITVEPPLTGEQDYILMFIDLKDVDGVQLEFDTGIYDFKTPVFPQEIQMTNEGESGSGNVLPELNAAGDDLSLEKQTLLEPIILETSGTGVVEIASTVTQTPATGTATWILILSTLFINAFYIFTRRKKV